MVFCLIPLPHLDRIHVVIEVGRLKHVPEEHAGRIQFLSRQPRGEQSPDGSRSVPIDDPLELVDENGNCFIPRHRHLGLPSPHEGSLKGSLSSSRIGLKSSLVAHPVAVHLRVKPRAHPEHLLSPLPHMSNIQHNATALATRRAGTLYLFHQIPETGLEPVGFAGQGSNRTKVDDVA